jgi:gamma-glutamylcyclotransferase (GGCT)/AIG2-like uncharacterized protein YtfP
LIGLNDMHNVFVYGTLRQGGVREMPRLFPQTEFIGFGTAKGRLYDFGAYPGFLPDAAGGDVLGEVYAVPAIVLQALDDIERFEPNNEAGSYYHRREVSVTMRDGSCMVAWVYVCNPQFYNCSRLIDNNDWIAHAAAKGSLPPESWPDGAPIKKQA